MLATASDFNPTRRKPRRLTTSPVLYSSHDGISRSSANGSTSIFKESGDVGCQRPSLSSSDERRKMRMMIATLKITKQLIASVIGGG